MSNAEQRTDPSDEGHAGSDPIVHDDLEPDRDEAEEVAGGRDAATGLPTGQRMHKP